MRRAILGLLVVVMAAGTAAAVVVVPTIDHEPWLNWDLVLPPGANDIRIVVDNPNFVPGDIFEDLVNGWHYDGPISMGGNTILKWSAADPTGGMVHIGADMRGSGGIIGGYWTKNGLPFDPPMPIPIIWELTRIIGPIPGDPANPVEVWMRLRTSPEFGATGQEVRLSNIRTYFNIPANRLGLDDLNADLDEVTLVDYKGMQYPGLSASLPYDIDSFFDVFVEVTPPENSSPDFESLLVADVVVMNPTGGGYTIVGTFWNLNPQSPEPATLALLAIGGLAALRRRRGK